jgi:tripeptidyl-peptidase-2
MLRFILLAALLLPVFAWSQEDTSFPIEGLLPKRETGALRFLEAHPSYDGRGIVVAILDSGIDPGAEGLLRTPDGRPKIVDVVDATGSGDVATTCMVKAEEGTITGLTGRVLTVGKDWQNPTGNLHLGMKAGWELFPSSLTSRLKKDRREAFEAKNHELRRSLLAEHIALSADDDKDKRTEWQARIDAVDAMLKSYKDPGPIFDCVVFHDGSHWQAVIDTDEDGDLNDEAVLTNYRIKRQFASFSDASQLNFAVNIREEGKLLSIVVPSNMHGTHVAGIVGGHYPNEPELNGLAPGVQFVSVKIGDSRLDGMETGSAVVRGLKAVLDHGCQMINMSYGEPTRLPNQGRIMRLIEDVVHEHRVIFVASAGNAGPALNTVGAPGGSSSAVIGVGAYVTPSMRKAGYSLMKERPEMAFTWSSRGPTFDGAAGVSICAPGGALAPVPNWTLRRNRWANGTSMSSPNACGAIALLLSALEQEEIPYSAQGIRRAVENTAEPILGEDRASQGYGLLQIDRAFALLSAKTMPMEPRYRVRITERNHARGLYLREAAEVEEAKTYTVTIDPKFTDHFPNRSKLQLNQRLLLSSDAHWVTCPDVLMQTNKLSTFKIRVDPTDLRHGTHLAEVVAVDSEHPELGPMFRVPITVIRPHEPTGTLRASADMVDSDLSRHFLTPPAGAHWMRIQLHSNSAEPSSAILHVQQNVPQRRHAETGHNTRFTLNSDPDQTYTLSIVPNRTVEVTLADNWSSEGDLNYEMRVDFMGMDRSTDLVSLSASRPVDSLSITAALDDTKLQPSGSLTHWQRDVTPS